MSGGPPGIGGSSDGGIGGGFGHVGESGACYAKMAQVLQRAGEVRDNVEVGSIIGEKCVKEIAIMMIDLTKASGRIFEQEHLRMISMVSAINPGGSGRTGGNRFTAKGIMEHKVSTNLRMVNGDKSLFRQWQQMFITALGQVDGAHEEMI